MYLAIPGAEAQLYPIVFQIIEAKSKLSEDRENSMYTP